MNNLKKYHFSVIIPVYNEFENLNELYENLLAHLNIYQNNYEIIFVDDGSTDNSFEILESLANKNPDIRLIQFRRNFGQTAAMTAGIEAADSELIIFMDSDLQNDAADIPILLQKINEGYDVVSGWRKSRKDKLFLKKVPSKIANYIIRKVSGVRIHDMGCTLKAYRMEIIREIKLYGELHRFLPVLAAQIGAKITEVPVIHHKRKFGKSKYGLNRTFKVILDLITVKFMHTFSTKPIYLYGGFSLLTFFLGVLSGCAVLFMKFFWQTDITGNPFFLITILFVLISVIFLLMGIQSEVLIRIYHQQGKEKQYYIKQTKNIQKKAKYSPDDL